ncbi:RNA polymerase sigma-70 factor, ECF subfamily [Parapedobacter composti]|uniref:RNA polymerase sigma-70 factor, ECF subfamily n=1 Tax=Parapedobacter composti TaxID=623281 RepID=A0A1I1FB28_9SPHI|nr:RNA polymerase sigma-70 factor [Parapedobacter composti]SFB96494.1 RNA polymerase sigma-70 factor, ECF subfamily [Parapedobacter composti]
MDYQKALDQELWEACQQDDVKAYAHLFDRHAKPLYKRAVRFVKDSMLAEELVMDVLFSFWQKRNTLTTPDDIPSYLKRSVRNRILMELRKSLPGTETLDILAGCEPAESKSADHELISGDNEQIYQQLVGELPRQQQKIFRMNREENLSYAKIASVLGLSVNTVENHMSSALSTLRKRASEQVLVGLLIAFHLF